MLAIGKLCILKNLETKGKLGMYKSLNPRSQQEHMENYLGFFEADNLRQQPFLLLKVEKTLTYPWIKVLIQNKIGWIGIDIEDLDEFKG